jgi:hypothetical protein
VLTKQILGFFVIIFLLLAALIAPASAAAEPRDRNRQLQQSLNDTGVHPSWIYNDLNAGFAEAKKTSKPLLVVFR